ncbi:MAG: hypothetical protein K9I68_09290 [Bacteroidales bacterium]|nr:hypothetical protein [Bacteroidales bacterium]MCF8338739.1 hypothetical protein [Bacteroidales bacterium]
MQEEVLKNISTIIHRESKSSTYKFALLRATIESIDEYDQFIHKDPYKATIPMGLQVIKWMEYYYPIFASSSFIAQQTISSRTLAFRGIYNDVINYYKENIGPGYEIIFESLKKPSIPNPIYDKLYALIDKLQDTIQKQPMSFIGSSFGQGGRIFTYNNDRDFRKLKTDINLFNIISYSGSYTIPMQYYEAFRVMGKYLIGMDSLLSKWAEYTSNINSEIDKNKLYSIFYSELNYFRDNNKINSLKALLDIEKDIFCVWTGEKLSNDYHIDHVLPFSFLRNNDFWNLLPTKPHSNQSKRDMVPSPKLLQESKNLIFNYWDLYNTHFPQIFQNEVEVSLLGNLFNTYDEWKEKSLDRLMEKSDFLITELGYEPFYIQKK